MFYEDTNGVYYSAKEDVILLVEYFYVTAKAKGARKIKDYFLPFSVAKALKQLKCVRIGDL